MSIRDGPQPPGERVAKLWRLSQTFNPSLDLVRELERMMDKVKALRFLP